MEKVNSALQENLDEYKTIQDIVKRLESCSYQNESGILTKNVAFIKLQESGLKVAAETVAAAMNEDKAEGSYYYAWQSNIASCMLDAAKASGIELPAVVANEGAKNFLNLFIGS